MNYGWEIAKIAFYLVIVIGIIYLLNYFLRRGVFRPKKGRNMQVIEQLYLAPKKALSLVRVKDKIIMFSICEEKIEKIKEWDTGDFPVKGGSDKSFRDYLQQYLGGSR